MTGQTKTSVVSIALLLAAGISALLPALAIAQGVGTGAGSASGGNTGSSSSQGGGTNGTNGSSMSQGSQNSGSTGSPMSPGTGNNTANGSSLSQSPGSNGANGSSLSPGANNNNTSQSLENNGESQGNSNNATSGSQSPLQSPATGESSANGSPVQTRGANGLVGGGIQNSSNQSTSGFTLGSAIQATYASSSDLQIALNNLDRDIAEVSEAADANNPRVNVGGSYTHLDSPISIPFSGMNIVVQPENTQTFDASGVLPLDISGQVRAATQEAQLQVMADRFNVDRVRNALILNTQTSYFNVLRNQHQLSVAESALVDAKTQLATARTQYSGGIGQKIDVYRASTQVAQAQQNLLQAQNAIALAKDNFNDVVGRNLGADISAQDVPGVTTGVTVSANGLPAAVGSPDASVAQFYAPPAADLNGIDLNRDIDTAQKARPELRADMVNIAAAAKEITLARSDDAPTLSLSATGDYYPVTDFETPRHSLGVFVATVNIPVFDGGLTHDRVRAAHDEQKDEQATYSSDQTTVELQVRQAYLNLYTSSNQIAAANSALQEAIAARQLAQVRYANGVGLYLEVTDAEAALTSAENSQVNAVYDYLISRAQYENAIGTPSSNPTL